VHFDSWNFLGGLSVAMGFTYVAKVVGDRVRARVRQQGLPWR
jgi:hypothetical protein